MSGRKSRNAIETALCDFALGFPEAYEENPWDHRAIKVRKKTFVFLGTDEGGVGMSVKLPESRHEALLLPFTEPTGYGLGKSGWVSSRFAPGDDPPMGLLRSWIDESYRAIAPKKLVATLDGSAPVVGAAKAKKKKVASKRKSVRKKA